MLEGRRLLVTVSVSTEGDVVAHQLLGLIHRNVCPGELPWRISFFTLEKEPLLYIPLPELAVDLNDPAVIATLAQLFVHPVVSLVAES